MWSLDNTILSHTPNNQSDANKMSDTINKKIKELTDIIMLARNLTSLEKIREREELEDGVMRIIE